MKDFRALGKQWVALAACEMHGGSVAQTDLLDFCSDAANMALEDSQSPSFAGIAT